MCRECGQKIRIGDWPFPEPGGGHKPLRASDAQHFDPVVVYRDSDGQFRFPGSSKEPTPKGSERIELRTTAQVRRFERQMSARQKRQAESKMERRDAFFSELQRRNRSELRQRMQHMSARGREFAEMAMKRGDERSFSIRARKFDPNFRVTVFS